MRLVKGKRRGRPTLYFATYTVRIIRGETLTLTVLSAQPLLPITCPFPANNVS